MSEQETTRDLEKENAILRLAVPLEDELAARIDDTCKHLAMQDGYTLNGIARLLVDCQRRMATDWTEIGRARREVKAAREGLAALVDLWRAGASKLHRDGNDRDHVRESQSYCYGQEHAYDACADALAAWLKENQ